MHILVLTDAFLPDHTGGISRSLLPEIEGLCTLGHQISVVSRQHKVDSLRQEVRDSHTLYRYFCFPKNSKFYRVYPLFSLITLPQLLTCLHKEHRFDIAYAHNPFQVLGFYKTLPDVPCIYVYHASVYSEINIDAARGKYGVLSPMVSFLNRGVRLAENKILKAVDQVIVRSQYMKADMNHLYTDIRDDKVITLPLCVDTELFSPTNDIGLVRRYLGLPEDRPILLTVRRLVARMGIENLLFAMQAVVNQFPKTLLLIGGTGYLEKDFHNLIKQYNLQENVQMLGFIPDKKLPAYYQASDLFILPTLAYEGFGLVTIEALACGTPVIATPVGASPEILRSLGEEFLFKDSSSEAITEGISQWLTKGFSIQVRHQCVKYCNDHFSKQYICRKLDQILSAATYLS